MLYAYSVLWCAGTETVAFGPIVTFRAEIADDSPRNDRIELVPQDDGAVKHLLGMEVPRIALQATDGTLSGPLWSGPICSLRISSDKPTGR